MTNEQLTKQELQEKKIQLECEIDALQKVIDASDISVFDILVHEVKTAMGNNIAEENWKELKQNQKKIEAYRDVEKIITNQNDLLRRKEKELEDVETRINNYQLNMFEENEKTDKFAKPTGIKYASSELETGDVFRSNIPNYDDIYSYYLIKESSEMQDSFAIISDSFEEERLLQYPKNQELLCNTHYVGNIFKDDDDQADALKGLEIISESKKDNNSSNLS